jgi:DNA-binding NarL/FixJ family response regulator
MIRILLVDDHAVVRRGLKEILTEELGVVKFGEAGTASEAHTVLAQCFWDLVILDISLPERSGIDLLKDIKYANRRQKVLMLSMYDEGYYAVRALKAGASGYLTKDTVSEELGRAVRRVLSGRKYITPALAERLAFELTNDTDKEPHEQLSDREFQVMHMIAQGFTVSEIADRLKLSSKTISTYRMRLLEKMHMKTNAEVTSYAVRNGLAD